MSLNTTTYSAAPYHDDYDENKGYLKVLFKANKDFFNSRLGIYDLKNNNPNKKESINLYLKKINLK